MFYWWFLKFIIDSFFKYLFYFHTNKGIECHLSYRWRRRCRWVKNWNIYCFLTWHKLSTSLLQHCTHFLSKFWSLWTFVCSICSLPRRWRSCRTSILHAQLLLGIWISRYYRYIDIILCQIKFRCQEDIYMDMCIL